MTMPKHFRDEPEDGGEEYHCVYWVPQSWCRHKEKPDRDIEMTPEPVSSEDPVGKDVEPSLSRRFVRALSFDREMDLTDMDPAPPPQSVSHMYA